MNASPALVASAPVAPVNVPTVLHLAEALTHLHKVTSHELAGPCPFCGGSDRFHVAPVRDRWMCRGCRPKWSDAIDLVRARDGIGYRAACRILGIVPGERLTSPVEAEQEPVRDAGSPEWVAACREAVRLAGMALWGTPTGKRRGPDGQVIHILPCGPRQGAQEALRFLRARGIRDETARAWWLGFATGDPVLLREGPAPWPSFSVAGPGVLIPWVAAGALWQAKVRLLCPRPNGPKLLHPRWTDRAREETCPPPCAAPHLFGADTLRGREVAILCEGEMDAILLHQEAGDLVGTCTLGSATNRLPERALSHLVHLRRILVAYDADDSGRQGSERLRAAWPGLPIEIVDLPLRADQGKDLTDLHRAGWSLRRWVRCLLDHERTTIPRKEPTWP